MGKRKCKNNDAAKASTDQPSFRVQIVPDNGPNFTLEIKKNATVLDLKGLVKQRMGLSKQQQQFLKYNGCSLPDSKRLEESFRASLLWRLVLYILALCNFSNVDRNKQQLADVTLHLQPGLSKDWHDVDARDHCYFDHENDVDLRSLAYDFPRRKHQRHCCGYLKSLKVRDKYESNAWLGDAGNRGEWDVAYHGSSYENIQKIVRDGRLLVKFGKNFVHGRGIYCSPNPIIALTYAKEFLHKGVDHKAILQVRVHPEKVKKFVGDYWLLPQDYIRITGVCIYSKDDYPYL